MTITHKIKTHPYYNLSKVLSYNGVYNFVVGARGYGKTYGFKKHVINRNIKAGEQFIYVRRYKTELVQARNTFFADVSVEFPEWEFRINAGVAQRASVETADEKKREWITMGYFVALSTAQTMKSVAFPEVRHIIFDEFIIEKGAFHYLPSETDIFNNFYSTVDRSQDKTRVYFLANSVTIMNPYFIEYAIYPDRLPELSTRAENFIVCHFPDSKDFRESVSATRFGRFISGTDYEKYAVGNEFHDASDQMVGGKHSSARCRFILETDKGKVSVWYSTRTRDYYVQEKLPKGGDVLMLTLSAEKLDEGKVLVRFNDKILSGLRTAYRNAGVVFDSPRSRNAFAELFRC